MPCDCSLEYPETSKAVGSPPTSVLLMGPAMEVLASVASGSKDEKEASASRDPCEGWAGRSWYPRTPVPLECSTFSNRMSIS